MVRLDRTIGVPKIALSRCVRADGPVKPDHDEGWEVRPRSPCYLSAYALEPSLNVGQMSPQPKRRVGWPTLLAISLVECDKVNPERTRIAGARHLYRRASIWAVGRDALVVLFLGSTGGSASTEIVPYVRVQGLRHAMTGQGPGMTNGWRVRHAFGRLA